MDYRDTPEEAEFRADLRQWLAERIPAGWDKIEDPEEAVRLRKAWHRTLYQAGYVGMSWPEEYGGRGLSPVYDAILNEEAGNLNAPPLPSVGYIGRAIFTYASEEQKKRFLPPLLSGDAQWCQGFSEPEAGSDLASLRTAARLDGDHYVVNGQKMWTSGGQYADWCLLLARTDPDVPKHKGISAFLVSMTEPGVTVRPIMIASGEAETAEVFWDDVRIPAEQRLGAPGEGWRIAMTTVAYERGPADIGFIAAYRRTLRKVERLAAERGLLAEPETRKRLARAYVRGEVLRLNCMEQLSLRVSGRPPGPEGSVAKLLWAEAEQSLQHLAMDILGADELTGAAEGWLSSYFTSRPVSVYGGSAQIQKNIIARMLDLPR
ncbi:acyl-CoA dehydrogenase [Acrocarpospora pleiomorpha]|uniref:Acyl-CoA dehydrogenase n=1 Tax=Acrocarpospora pleiomorpha TaxID=90975 RepID=A0A5M3X7P6_9ACTN|nr:acyl-CoA dehydrogenase family protein [Acrocarpospora pleiomorpha]GES17110.1 acyl-CoA dehydrogenase [Acrocarpospora pleiomorpha]